MMSSTTRTTSARLDSAVDDAVVAYAEWRHASAAVRDAYGQWESAARADYACAHARPSPQELVHHDPRKAVPATISS